MDTASSASAGVNDAGAFMELSFAPNLRLVSIVREFVNTFYDEVLEDPDSTSRLALATHELLENAVKYGTEGKTRVRIDVQFGEAGGTVAVRTWNHATPENVEAVRRLVEEMGRESDADAFYQALLVRVARQTTGSGLGIGRIHAEAQMTIRFDLDNGELCVIAESSFKSATKG